MTQKQKRRVEQFSSDVSSFNCKTDAKTQMQSCILLYDFLRPRNTCFQKLSLHRLSFVLYAVFLRLSRNAPHLKVVCWEKRFVKTQRTDCVETKQLLVESIFSKRMRRQRSWTREWNKTNARDKKWAGWQSKKLSFSQIGNKPPQKHSYVPNAAHHKCKVYVFFLN